MCHNHPRRRTCRRIRFETNVEITKWNYQKYYWWRRFQRTHSLQKYSTFRNVLTTFPPTHALTRDGVKTHKKFPAGRNQFVLVVMLLVINIVLLIMLLQLVENSKLFLLQMMVLQLKSWKFSTLVVSYWPIIKARFPLLDSSLYFQKSYPYKCSLSAVIGSAQRRFIVERGLCRTITPTQICQGSKMANLISEIPSIPTVFTRKPFLIRLNFGIGNWFLKSNFWHLPTGE